jgi:MFS family permease
VQPTRLLSRQYLLVVGATFLFFASFGASLPVLPRYVVDVLGRGDTVVGFVFAAYAMAAVAVRPLIGRVGDRSGRRLLIQVGAVLTAVALLGHLAADTVPLLVAMRLLAGAGQAAVLVGFTTMALDLAPPARQGEAASYVMVALQLGLGFGPLLGELLLITSGFAAVWVVSAIGSLVCVGATALFPPEVRRAAIVTRGLLHPAALRPGAIVFLGALGFVGWLAFMPLYGRSVGLTQVAPLFLLCSGTIALVRILGAKLPDRVGAVPLATIGLAVLSISLITMGLAPSVVGLYVTTVGLGIGTAILAPSMVLAAIQGSADDERAQVMATFTMFLDLASAIGPTALGLAAASTGYGPTFVVAGGAAGVGLVLLRVWLAPQLNRRRLASASPVSDPVTSAPPASHPVASDPIASDPAA